MASMPEMASWLGELDSVSRVDLTNQKPQASASASVAQLAVTSNTYKLE